MWLLQTATPNCNLNQTHLIEGELVRHVTCQKLGVDRPAGIEAGGCGRGVGIQFNLEHRRGYREIRSSELSARLSD